MNLPPESKAYWRPAMITFARMSGWVAGPVVLAVVVGKWLDGKFGTEPYIFIAVIGLGFFVSIFGILKESKRYIRSIETKPEKKDTIQ